MLRIHTVRYFIPKAKGHRFSTLESDNEESEADRVLLRTVVGREWDDGKFVLEDKIGCTHHPVGVPE